MRKTTVRCKGCGDVVEWEDCLTIDDRAVDLRLCPNCRSVVSKPGGDADVSR